MVKAFMGCIALSYVLPACTPKQEADLDARIRTISEQIENQEIPIPTASSPAEMGTQATLSKPVASAQKSSGQGQTTSSDRIEPDDEVQLDHAQLATVLKVHKSKKILNQRISLS